MKLKIGIHSENISLSWLIEGILKILIIFEILKKNIYKITKNQKYFFLFNISKNASINQERFNLSLKQKRK